MSKNTSTVISSAVSRSFVSRIATVRTILLVDSYNLSNDRWFPSTISRIRLNKTCWDLSDIAIACNGWAVLIQLRTGVRMSKTKHPLYQLTIVWNCGGLRWRADYPVWESNGA